MTRHAHPKYVLYLAVLPHYRQACVDNLLRALGDDICLYAGQQHMDGSVTTGIRPDQYTPVTNRFFLSRRLMLQTGHWLDVLWADTAILDLNPRNLSVWLLTIVRRLARRRTLHWGHLHPRGGPAAGTARLRRALRLLSQGTVLYGYDQASQAQIEMPKKPTWVAANSLYTAAQLKNHFGLGDPLRVNVIYVGRLIAPKKVRVLIEAFARTAAGKEAARLMIVGTGDEIDGLKTLAGSLHLGSQVTFAGAVTDPDRLRDLYSQSFVSVSPGYVGLNLTQSLGFGVPMLASRDEPHSPEIELASFGHVDYFDTDDADSLASRVDQAWQSRDMLDPDSVAAPIISYFTVEVMAGALAGAFQNKLAITRQSTADQQANQKEHS